MTWQRVKVGDLCKVGRGSSPRPINDSRFFEDGDIPWVKVADATASGKYLYETKEHVNKFGASFSRLLPAGSLIICTSGTLGYPIFLGVDGCIHDGWLYTFDYNGLDPHFFYYFLKVNSDYFYSVAYGAAIQNINTEILRNTPISLPPLENQHRIAAILSAYDDLIENNRRRIQLLEQAARLIYQEWFVRLRFPGHERVRVVDGVPEGWERKELRTLCDEIRDAVRANRLDPTSPYIGLEHMPRRSITLSDWGVASEVQSDKHVFRKGDILFGKIRSYFHKVGVCLTDGVASTDAIVIRPRSESHFSLVLMTVSSDLFVAHATQSSHGSKMPRANWRILERFPVLVPSESLLRDFNDLIEPIVSQLRTLALANRKLQEARDLLLPRLMSGEIEV